MQLKVCGLREKENVAQVAALHPDFMGFIFYPKSSRYVGKLTVDTLSVIPSSIQKVAVFVDESVRDIERIATFYQFRYLQLHGNETPSTCLTLQQKGYKVIKAFGIGESFDFQELTPYVSCCDYFLFDTKTPSYGGAGTKFNWDILLPYPFQVPLFLSGGIQEEDIPLILPYSHRLPIAVVDINSRFELAPALKDVKKIERFMKQIS